MLTTREELQNLINELVKPETGIRGIFLFNPSNALILLSSQSKLAQDDNIDFESVVTWLTRLNLPTLSKMGFGEVHSGTFIFSEAACYFQVLEPTEDSLILIFVCTDSAAFALIKQQYLPVLKNQFRDFIKT